MPALDALMSDTADAETDALAEALAAGFGDGSSVPREVRAAVALALDFWTWRRLAQEGLSDESAARLLAEAVESAAQRA
jgi:hypothetical protein